MPKASLVYLSRSRVQGNIGPRSDIDFGVLIEDPEEREPERSRLAHEFRKAMGTERVDVVLLDRAPIELVYAVIAGGECIFQRDEETRVEFEAKILSMYGDYLPVLRAQRKDILQGENHDRRVQRYREVLRRTERTLSQFKLS